MSVRVRLKNRTIGVLMVGEAVVSTPRSGETTTKLHGCGRTGCARSSARSKTEIAEVELVQRHRRMAFDSMGTLRPAISVLLSMRKKDHGSGGEEDRGSR